MKKWMVGIVYVLFSYSLVEAALRMSFMYLYHTPFLKPADIIYRYYPQIPPIQNAEISETDSILDVLVLSCSVLHHEWGNFGDALRKHWQPHSRYTELRVFNASGIGHSSLDNRIKRQLLKGKKFDAVLYYDAINDARLNNCPAEVYKADYSHYRWYQSIHTILQHPEINFTVLPYIVHVAYNYTREVLGAHTYIPEHYSLQPDWLSYGNELKSLNAYKTNFSYIVEACNAINTPLFYIPFVYYIPPDYSLKKFIAHELDYTYHIHSREVEIWGSPGNVSQFIDTVNVSISGWVNAKEHVRVIDMNTFPKTGNSFADVCHFSTAGMDTFAAIIARQL